MMVESSTILGRLRYIILTINDSMRCLKGNLENTCPSVPMLFYDLPSCSFSAVEKSAINNMEFGW